MMRKPGTAKSLTRRALTYRILDAYLGGEEHDWTAQLAALAERNRERAAERRAEFEGGRIEGTSPSHPLEEYTGTYGGALYGDATVTVEGDHLVVAFIPNPDLVGDLTHRHFDTFVLEWRQDFAWFYELEFKKQE